MKKYNLFVNGKKKNDDILIVNGKIYDIKKECEEMERLEKKIDELFSSRRFQEKVKKECRKVHTMPFELFTI